MKKILLVLLVTLVPALAFAAGPKVPVDPAGNDLADKESLKRGFRAYINYCLACHQLQYQRYNRTFADLGISDKEGKANWMPTGEKVGDHITNTMPAKEAAKWFRMAAEQGDSDAQSILGIMYDDGQGVVQDYKEAAKWYRLAAEQGYSDAQYNLGVLYFNGQGVVQDYKLAHMWLNIAATDGDEVASKGRETVARKMSSEDVSKAQDMAREWVKNH